MIPAYVELVNEMRERVGTLNDDIQALPQDAQTKEILVQVCELELVMLSLLTKLAAKP